MFIIIIIICLLILTNVHGDAIKVHVYNVIPHTLNLKITFLDNNTTWN